MTAADLAGVVLAGGESSRFDGGDKALATLGGRPLLAHAVDAVGAATREPPVVVVRNYDDAGAYRDVLPSVATVVRDDGRFEGPLAGLFGGLDAVEAGWAVAVGCDMPLVSPGVVAWLADQRAPGVDAVALRPRDGVRESLHALYRVDAALAVRERLPPTAGPQALLDEVTVMDVRPSDAPPSVDVGASLADVDTIAELRDLE